MFYNVENLFDTRNDSLTADDDFTPAGRMHWTNSRYFEKLNKISKVIIAAGGWQPPAVVGFCEIENRKVLNDLINSSALSKFPYQIVHGDSPDERGIDVALIYDSRYVRILSHRLIKVGHRALKTRDILYAKALTDGDTLHLFINHWPSRSGGQLESDPDRMFAAKVLRKAVDSVFVKNRSAKIIITGDFNDEPDDRSLKAGLKALPLNGINQKDALYNLTAEPKGAVKGTLKYQGDWNLFDQIIVSGGMLVDSKGLNTNKESYKIYHNSFMLETDYSFSGVKPFRTYLGFRYHGGFSDHLPVILEIH